MHLSSTSENYRVPIGKYAASAVPLIGPETSSFSEICLSKIHFLTVLSKFEGENLIPGISV
jgi:hypothetical protein